MDLEGETMDEGFSRLHIAPVVADGELPCARVLCGDGYTWHVVNEELGACTICPCRGFLWVPPLVDA
jgi:hypothetical protein